MALLQQCCDTCLLNLLACKDFGIAFLTQVCFPGICTKQAPRKQVRAHPVCHKKYAGVSALLATQCPGLPNVNSLRLQKLPVAG